LPGKGDRTAATIMVVALSMAVTWGADSAVIAEIVPRLKCFLKQEARDYINKENRLSVEKPLKD
jgi:hypothetical protein